MKPYDLKDLIWLNYYNCKCVGHFNIKSNDEYLFFKYITMEQEDSMCFHYKIVTIFSLIVLCNILILCVLNT